MKSRVKTFMSVIMLMTSMHSIAGSVGGNGGDVVECEENGIKVLRTLDSAVMKRHRLYTYKTMNSEERITAILSKLKENQVFIAEHFEWFIWNYKTKGRKSGVLWLEGKLMQVNDESLFTIPENCSAPAQAVIKYSNGKDERYYYNAPTLEKLELVDDELSWMLVHEWLRATQSNSDDIRMANAFIQSENFLKSDHVKVMKFFKKLNFTVYDNSSFDVIPQIHVELDKIDVKMDYVERRLKEKDIRTQTSKPMIKWAGGLTYEIEKRIDKIKTGKQFPYENGDVKALITRLESQLSRATKIWNPKKL